MNFCESFSFIFTLVFKYNFDNMCRKKNMPILLENDIGGQNRQEDFGRLNWHYL